MIWIVAAFLLIITPIVVIHEFGHFIAAKIAGIHVEEFGVGLPPRAAKLFSWRGTLFSFNWIPLGGFVRVSGENNPEVAGGLAASHWVTRIFVLVSGALANFVTAFFILIAAFMLGPRATEVTEVKPNMPGMMAGIQPGDILLSINGVRIDSPALFSAQTRYADGNSLKLKVRRNGEVIALPLTPLPISEAIDGGVVGISFDQLPTSPYLRRTLSEAAGEAKRYLEIMVKMTASAPKMLAQGEMTPEQARPMSIIGIGDLAGKATAFSISTGSWFPFLLTMGVISAGLGLTQLLPLPALDGGRIFLALLEGVRGKPLPAKREAQLHHAGMILLLALMLFLIGLDMVAPIF